MVDTDTTPEEQDQARSHAEATQTVLQSGGIVVSEGYLRAADVEARLRHEASAASERAEAVERQLKEAREEIARLRAIVVKVAPAVAVLSRAREVAPEIRSELADVERLIIAGVAS